MQNIHVVFLLILAGSSVVTSSPTKHYGSPNMKLRCIPADCPSPDSQEWKFFQETIECCHYPSVYHCQTGKDFRTHVVCSVPVFCDVGHFARLHEVTGRVSCDTCTGSIRQSEGMMSHFFTKEDSGCDSVSSTRNKTEAEERKDSGNRKKSSTEGEKNAIGGGNASLESYENNSHNPRTSLNAMDRRNRKQHNAAITVTTTVHREHNPNEHETRILDSADNDQVNNDKIPEARLLNSERNSDPVVYKLSKDTPQKSNDHVDHSTGERIAMVFAICLGAVVIITALIVGVFKFWEKLGNRASFQYAHAPQW